MDINKDKRFLTYLVLGASLGAAYWLINHLSNRKTSSAKPLPLEKTRKIIQQIKYQILTTCTSFVEDLQLKPKSNHSQQELEIFYRSELAKVYEMREDNTLAKYNVTRDEYASSLNTYKNDEKIKQGQTEIFQMLQNATKSLYPDLTVHRQARNLLSQQQVSQVYWDMCEKISVLVWRKLDQQTKKNPAFNSKNDADFKRAVRQLSIYDLKVEFLESKGFKSVWGCPNEVFFKVMESMKQQNKQIKYKTAAVDKAYEKVIDKITKQLQNLNPERIKFLFDEVVNDRVPEKPVPQVQPKPQIVSKKSEPVKKNDDFNMDELMMQQLMSRSQEQPKQEQKVQILKEEIKEEVVVQQEAKQEQNAQQAPQVLGATQVVSVNVEVAQPEVQGEKVENQQNQGVVESQSQATTIVQLQQKVQQIKVEPTQEEVRVEEVKQEVQQKKVQEQKAQAELAPEPAPVEQPEPRQQ